METPSLEDLRAVSPYVWIQKERERQDARWGKDCNHDALHYLMVLSEEMGEVSKVLNEAWEGTLSGPEYHRKLEYEIIQVAAVACKWLEAIRRNKDTAQFPKCGCSACTNHK